MTTAFAVIEFAVVPPLDRLGAVSEVRCYQCRRRILPGRKGPITQDERGVRHGNASGACGAWERVTAPDEVTVAMLAKSTAARP